MGCLISSTTELHVCLIYTWIWSPYEICDLQFFSFHSLPLHFFWWLLLLCRRFWVWCGLTSLFFQLLPLLLMIDLFELLVFWKAILYQLFYLLLSSPILNKRHKLAEWIQKQDPYISCLQEAHFSPRDSYRLKVRGWKKIFHANGNPKKTRLTIFISDLKIKSIIRTKKGHYKMIKGWVQEKDKTNLNIYIPDIGALQYIRWTRTDIKWEIGSNAIRVGHVNTPPLPMDRSLKQKINKET